MPPPPQPVDWLRRITLSRTSGVLRAPRYMPPPPLMAWLSSTRLPSMRGVPYSITQIPPPLSAVLSWIRLSRITAEESWVQIPPPAPFWFPLWEDE